MAALRHPTQDASSQFNETDETILGKKNDIYLSSTILIAISNLHDQYQSGEFNKLNLKNVIIISSQFLSELPKI